MLLPEIRERRRKLFTILGECIKLSREKELKNSKWIPVSEFFEDILQNLEAREEPIWATSAQSLDDPSKISWAEDWELANDNQRRRKASFRPWVEKAYKSSGLPLPEQGEAILQMAATTYGEALLRGEEEFVEVYFGEDIPEKYRSFNSTALESCMTSRTYYLDLYVQNPDVVSLVVLYRKGSEGTYPAARALLWEAKTDEYGAIRVLDRVYSIDYSAYLSLRDWALAKGYFVKKVNKGPVTEDHPLVNHEGKKVYSAWVVFEEAPEYWPYLDTFYYVKLNPGRYGGVLFTDPDRYEGVLPKARTTCGELYYPDEGGYGDA